MSSAAGIPIRTLMLNLGNPTQAQIGTAFGMPHHLLLCARAICYCRCTTAKEGEAADAKLNRWSSSTTIIYAKIHRYCPDKYIPGQTSPWPLLLYCKATVQMRRKE
ncbi:hypothetical protein MN608_06288 [Microdochium nivale]|nr:hypothetical protein MN608_06288 [Microdochium nivale]